jgi:tetraprenyl-beta-curcumene synthase
MVFAAEHEQQDRASARRDAPALGMNAERRLAPAGVFAIAALRYWLSVFPRVRRELHRLRRRAHAIPDPVLRELALAALAKRGNIEGAAAFAAFVARAHRGGTVRALVAFQATYNYVDMLAEQPNDDPVANARRLHEALPAALDPGAAQPDYYAHHAQREEHAQPQDGGYLSELVQSCRLALGELPSYPAVAEQARRAGARIVAFQSLSLGSRREERDALERWARAQTPAGSELEWWETAAAAGSSLCVHALIAAAAADIAPGPRELAAVEEAYFPWIGALHSLLDSVVDEVEDARTGQLSLIGCYASSREAAIRMRWLAARAIDSARGLPDGREHAVLVAGMAGYYLSGVSGTDASTRDALTDGVREEIGGLARAALLVFKVRRACGGSG